MKMSSRRRAHMSMWTEGRRKSPRISALELNASSNAQQSRRRNGSGTSHGPSSSTRGRKKRRLKQLCVSAHRDPSSTDEQDCKQLGHEDNDDDSDQLVVQDDDIRKCQNEASNPGSRPSELWLPEKRILELILDTLQRRDTREIFAEPVDPDKVEDYYDIIQAPMDFGTMRAKLHEGMYRNLAQFEHDVFLITKNAMHFNSSGTVYFRQARAIDDLATKVFHDFKTDPENFEFEFSNTRRRSARRRQIDSNPSVSSSYAKVATNLRSSNDASSRTLNSSMSGSSNFTRRGNSRCTATANRFQTKDHGQVFGATDGKRSSFSEADRRCTYRSLTSPSLDESNSISFSSYIDFKTLLHVNQKDISYRESLMTFVKDLGPTAKLVAQRKLAAGSNCQTSRPQCWFQTNEHQNNETSSTAQGRPPVLNTATSSLPSQNVPNHLRLHGHSTVFRHTDHKMDIGDTDKRGRRCTSEDTDNSDVEIIEVLPSKDKRCIPSVFAGKVSNSNDMTVIDVPRNSRMRPDQKAGKMLSFADFRCLNSSVPKLHNTGHESTFLKGKHKLDNRPESLIAASDYSRPENTLDYRVNNNINLSSSLRPLQTNGASSFCQTNSSLHNLSVHYPKNDGQATAAKNRIHGIGCSAEVGEASKSTQPQQPPSQFIYDLSYLKSRLDQSRFSQQGSSGMKDQTLIPHNGGHQLSLLNPGHTELPLRLLR